MKIPENPILKEVIREAGSAEDIFRGRDSDGTEVEIHIDRSQTVLGNKVRSISFTFDLLSTMVFPLVAIQHILTSEVFDSQNRRGFIDY